MIGSAPTPDTQTAEPTTNRETCSQLIQKAVFFNVNNMVIPWTMNRLFLMVTYRLKYS